jgi:hypothetical protein
MENTNLGFSVESQRLLQKIYTGISDMNLKADFENLIVSITEDILKHKSDFKDSKSEKVLVQIIFFK